LEALRCNLATITNAASFIEDYKLGEVGQLLHIPILNPKTVPLDIGFIYKAKEGRRAILYFGEQTSADDYVENAELGETVCASLFPN